MAARLLANLLVMGSGIVVRAFTQSYHQALRNASKSGVAQETVQNIRRVKKSMAVQEARQVLGITEQSTWEEILKKYDKLFEQNAKSGSFYLQSKVHRAKECLEATFKKEAERLTRLVFDSDTLCIRYSLLPDALFQFFLISKGLYIIDQLSIGPLYITI